MKNSMDAPPLAGRILGPAGGSFLIAEWADEGGSTGPQRPIAPLHVHHDDDEAWYVLEGALGFQLGDKELVAPAGAAVFAPRGVAHAYWNASAERTRYVIVMTPNIFRLIEEIHAAADRDPPALRRLFEQHGSELL
jgi:mannose-6-phosphate isomerase-like protein (cupin superfamily)